MQKPKEFSLFSREKHPTKEYHQKGGKSVIVQSPVIDGWNIDTRQNPLQNFLHNVPQNLYQTHELGDIEIEFESGTQNSTEKGREGNAGFSIQNFLSAGMKGSTKNNNTKNDKWKFKITMKKKEF